MIEPWDAEVIESPECRECGYTVGHMATCSRLNAGAEVERLRRVVQMEISERFKLIDMLGAVATERELAVAKVAELEAECRLRRLAMGP